MQERDSFDSPSRNALPDPLPDTLAEAIALEGLLVERITSIQTQLGNARDAYKAGGPSDPNAYFSWRARAKSALQHTLQSYRIVKQHRIAINRREGEIERARWIAEKVALGIAENGAA